MPAPIELAEDEWGEIHEALVDKLDTIRNAPDANASDLDTALTAWWTRRIELLLATIGERGELAARAGVSPCIVPGGPRDAAAPRAVRTFGGDEIRT